MYDLIIIGLGPAGLSAGIYASRYRLKNLIIGKEVGGTINLAHKVENYPGFESISGLEWSKTTEAQAKKLGSEVVYGLVERIEKSEDTYKVFLRDQQQFETKTIIIATGSERRKLNVPGETEYLGKGISYCTTCLLPGEEVVANNSLKKIDEIGISERVLTGDGTYQNINEIMSRNYDGEMVKIKTRYFTEPVKITANHPVSTITNKNGKPEWIEAGNLTLKNILLYPIVSEVKDVENIKFSEILKVKVENGEAVNYQETHTSIRLQDEIPVNKEFLRLVGYFLAEGCITTEGVDLFFNKKEEDLVKDVTDLFQKLFHLKPFIKIDGSVARIEIYSKLIRDLFQILFGKYAPNKKIPHWMLFLPIEKQAEIIKGYYRGDGCIREKDFCLVTTSRNLTYQLRDMLLRFKVIPSIVKREKEKLNVLPSEIGKRKIRFTTDKYHLVIGGTSLEKMSEILEIEHPKIKSRRRTNEHAWFKDNYLYLPIKGIEKEQYHGRVYNLAVEKNNTYVAKNFLVHNCDAPFYKNKTVALIGGSDAAVSGAVHTAEYAAKVYIIYRKDQLRAEPIWLEQALQNQKIEVIYNTNVTEILGDGNKVIGVKLDKPFNEKEVLNLDGVFIEIGAVPGTSLASELGVILDEINYVLVGEDMSTNLPGVFAAGDLTDNSKAFAQMIGACAQGAIAASSAYRFLKGEKAPRILGA